jgi:hypothetical protein
VQPREATVVSRRGTCDRAIWRKPLAFAADAEGYKYIVWVFNGRFAILSPELCQLSSFVAKERLGTAACYHSTQRKSCFHQNCRPRTRASVRRAAASFKSPLRVRREKALDFSGCNSRPGTGSLHPVATETTAEVTKRSELSVWRVARRLGERAGHNVQ